MVVQTKPSEGQNLQEHRTCIFDLCGLEQYDLAYSVFGTIFMFFLFCLLVGLHVLITRCRSRDILSVKKAS